MHYLHRSVLVHGSAHRRCRQLDECRLASSPRFAGADAASATLQIMIAEFEGGGDTAHTVSVSQLGRRPPEGFRNAPPALRASAPKLQ